MSSSPILTDDYEINDVSYDTFRAPVPTNDMIASLEVSVVRADTSPSSADLSGRELAHTTRLMAPPLNNGKLRVKQGRAFLRPKPYDAEYIPAGDGQITTSYLDR